VRELAAGLSDLGDLLRWQFRLYMGRILTLLADELEWEHDGAIRI